MYVNLLLIEKYLKDYHNEKNSNNWCWRTDWFGADS